MRLKDGWKDVEAAIHCAEWLTLIGGSSNAERRVQREESLPVIKRKLLGSLLDFAASELQLQVNIVPIPSVTGLCSVILGILARCANFAADYMNLVLERTDSGCSSCSCGGSS
jgi:hypothetical protein